MVDSAVQSAIYELAEGVYCGQVGNMCVEDWRETMKAEGLVHGVDSTCVQVAER